MIRYAKLLAAVSMLSLSQPAMAAGFVVFDALTRYHGKPDFSGLGMKPIRIVYANELWEPRPKGVSLSNWPPLELSKKDETRIRKLAHKWETESPRSLLCLDIEHWSLTRDEKTAQETAAKLAKVADWIHEEAPSLRLGFYGLMPIREYEKTFHGPGHPEFVKWQRQNDRILNLARHVDVIFPSLYTFSDDVELWKVYAHANLREAEKFKRPIFPFIWPQFHEFNKRLAGKDLSPSFWALQLRFIKDRADGAVLWGGGQPWNDSAGWWLETKKFLENLPR